MFATLTLRRSVPVSLPAWGAIGAVTLGGFLAGPVLLGATRAPHRGTISPVEQIAFDGFVVSTPTTLSLDSAVVGRGDAILAGGVAAIVRRGSPVLLIDAKTGKRIGSVGAQTDSAHSSMSVAPADSNRWIVLDGKRSTVDVVTSKGSRSLSISLPKGVWSSVAWDSVRRHAMVTGLELAGPKSAANGQSIHEFDERGIEVGAHRELAPITSRLQASFNMPFAALSGSIVISGSNLSNEVLVFDRSSGTERVIRVADNWFQPIDWTLPRQTSAPKTVAEPTLKWLASQTLLTAIIPLSHGRFVARFTQHSADREHYVYAFVDSVGHTRALTQPTTVRISSARGDTISGIDISIDGRARLFAGVVSLR